MWYEIKFYPGDIPWIRDTLKQALAKARRVAEKHGPVLVYECDSRDGERLVAIVD